jgi:hypothetical protein
MQAHAAGWIPGLRLAAHPGMTAFAFGAMIGPRKALYFLNRLPMSNSASSHEA